MAYVNRTTEILECDYLSLAQGQGAHTSFLFFLAGQYTMKTDIIRCYQL